MCTFIKPLPQLPHTVYFAFSKHTRIKHTTQVYQGAQEKTQHVRKNVAAKIFEPGALGRRVGRRAPSRAAADAGADTVGGSAVRRVTCKQANVG